MASRREDGLTPGVPRTPGSAGGSDGGTSDADAVEEANRALYAAVETADLDAMTRLWVDGPDDQQAVCVHPGWPPVVGAGHVLRSWALVMAGTPYIQFFLTDVRTTVVGDIGVVTCAENILTGLGGATAGSGGEGANAGFAGGRVVTTNVFRRMPDGWRVWVHHASPVLAVDDPAGGQQGADLEPGDE
jgi:ketosteroid isomerase-like protein